jgi:DNA-binding SARP family transcriptional activator/transposase-like protein
MDLRIQLLGGLEVWRGEERLDPLLSRQARTVIKVLLLAEGKPILSDQLIEILWPEEPLDLDRARRSLRARVYEVRRVLEPDRSVPYRYRHLQTVPGGYRFHLERWKQLDVAAFRIHLKRAIAKEEEGAYKEAAREYEAALELYRGDLLPEDRYEEWAYAPREELQRAHMQALIGAAEAYARQGKYRRALELGERALHRAGDLGEVREDLYRRLMLYHAQMGNLGGARRLYERCREELVERWGLEPGPQTQQLYERLLRGEETRAGVGYPSPAPEPILPGPGQLPFVGREEPYSRLVRKLIEVARGRVRGGLLLLEGEAGVGKTRLAQEALAYVRRELGAWVLYGAGSELGAKRPYQALRQALQGGLRFLPKEERERLARRLTDLGKGEGGSETSRAAEVERLRLLWDLGELLLSWARTAPFLVLFFDDLPWVDPSTQDFLVYLLGQLEWEEVPLVVLGTACTRVEEEESKSAVDPLGSLRSRVYSIELEPLPPEAIVDLLKQQAPTLGGGERTRPAEALHRGSGGNPLALTALLQTWVEEGPLQILPAGEWHLDVEGAERLARRALPRELQALLEARLARLDPQDRRLLGLLSVLGEAGEEELLRTLWLRLAGEEEWPLRERLGRLEGSLLLVAEGSCYRFAHERIGEVVYRRLSESERRWLHLHVAQAFKRFGDVPPRILGHHYARADRLEEAVPLLLEALQEAVEGYRNTEALAIAHEAEEALQRRASRIGEGTQESEDEEERLLRFWVELERDRVRAYDRLGRRKEQAEALACLLPLAERLGPAWAAEAYRLQAALHLETGEVPRAREAAAEGLRYALRTGDARLRCQALLQLALVHIDMDAYREAEALLDRVERDLPEGAELEAVQLFYYRGTVAWGQQRYDEGEQAYRRALTLLPREEKGRRTRLLLGLGNMHWAHGDYRQAIEAYEEALRLARESEDLRAEAHALSSLGLAWDDSGEYEKAETFLKQALDYHRRLGDKQAQGLDLNSLGFLALRLGTFGEAEAYLKEALRLFEELEWSHGKAIVLHNLGQLAWRRGRAGGKEGEEEQDQGLARMREALELLREMQEVRNRQDVLRDLGEALLERGEFSQALELFHEALGICQALKLREGEMVLRADQSLAYLGLDRLKEAETASEQALVLLQERKLEDSPQAARVWFARFRVLEAVGRREEAYKALDKAQRALLKVAERLRRAPQRRVRFLQAHPLSAPIREACTSYGLPVLNLQASEPPPPQEEEESCYERLRQARWPDGVRCPACGSGRVQAYGRVRRTPERRYLCRSCGKAFSDRTGTVFAHSNLPLSALYRALQLVAQAESLDSDSLVQEIQRSLQVSRRTAVKWVERLRQALQEDELVRRLVQREPERSTSHSSRP